jgi:hypothetical protein
MGERVQRETLMTDRANAALRLLHLSKQIEDLADRIRKGWNPEDSHTLWTICAAYERLRARLHEEMLDVARQVALPARDAPLSEWQKIFEEAA